MQQTNEGPGSAVQRATRAADEITGQSALTAEHRPPVGWVATLVWSDGHSVERLALVREVLG
jgi:hypothetical protein